MRGCEFLVFSGVFRYIANESRINTTVQAMKVVINKSVITFVSLFLVALVLSGCSSLLAPTVTRNKTITGYKYFYITPTVEKSSVVGAVVPLATGGSIGYSTSHNVNPTDLICGHFLKRGYTRLPELKPNLASETIVVNYGETGRRETSWFSYALEVTIQLISAESSEVICVGTAEGQGETEADDIRIAINRCMDTIFGTDGK